MMPREKRAKVIEAESQFVCWTGWCVDTFEAMSPFLQERQEIAHFRGAKDIK